MAEMQSAERVVPNIPLLSQMTQEGTVPGNYDPESSNTLDFPPLDADKRRPWSSQGIKTTLSPSPTLIESRRQSKDDNDVESSPSTSRRSGFATRVGSGLSLQMPPRDVSSTSTANLTTKRVPISPRPDPAVTFTSPTSCLPRRSRGMDFSRAATNLHHSTLAESSPESSPTVGGRRGVMIPPRKTLFANSNGVAFSDPSAASTTSAWMPFPSIEKSGLSTSIPSSTMMDDSSGSSSSDEDEMMDYGEDEDTVHAVPHVNGIGLMNPFGGDKASGPGEDAIGGFSAAAATKLLSYQRARVQGRRNRARNSSSSASGQSALQSPGPNSPPMLRTIESNGNIPGGFFLDEPTKKRIESRRESLSLGTNDMHLSDAEQSDDEGVLANKSDSELPLIVPITPSMEERKEVVRRAVTRRSNMLPKAKPFARIRAALLEEGAPVDTEVRREAEVIRQVRDSDADRDTISQPSQLNTSASSPSLGPLNAGPTECNAVLPEDTSLEGSEESSTRRSSSAFSTQAIKNSGGVHFWNNFDERMRTPPPIMVPRSNSSGVSDDATMETPQSSLWSVTPQHAAVKPDDTPPLFQPNAITRKGNKRMRDDDLDPNYFKRRAVSPGLSVQNSPVLPQSPGWWGAPSRPNRDTVSSSFGGERTTSNGSTTSASGGCGPKRVGLQGMNDTNDGLMNMSIE